MSWEPVRTRACTRGAEVTIALNRHGTRNVTPRVQIGASLGVWESIGVRWGDRVVVMLGSGMDAHKLRIVPWTACPEGTPLTVFGKGRTKNRGAVRLTPWFDFRGERRPSTPCEYRVEPGKHIEVVLPDNFRDLQPARKVA